MDDEIKKELDKIWDKISQLEGNLIVQNTNKQGVAPDKRYTFKDRGRKHSELLKDLLKSEYCHFKNGLTQKEVMDIFNENNRPVVPKKIRDLLHAWKKRKKIDAIKIKGKKELGYFWIEEKKHE